jgi:hypothetical protein
LLSPLITRHRYYDELSHTIGELLEEKIAELIVVGMVRDEAEKIARREFGVALRLRLAAYSFLIDISTPAPSIST